MNVSSTYLIIFAEMSPLYVFQNPDGVVVKQISRIRAPDGIYEETFPLSEMNK